MQMRFGRLLTGGAAALLIVTGSACSFVSRDGPASVTVRNNDRVAKKAKVTIDLSRQSARVLGIEGIGSVALYKVN